MATFSLERTAPLPLDEAWRRLTRWERHGDTVPLTRVFAEPPGPSGPGTVVVARTGAGPLAFDDRMEVTVWRPPLDDAPGLCRLEKRGRVVRGWAEIEVRRGPGGRARVEWREELDVPLLPAAFDGVLGRSGRYVFGRTVNHLLRQP
ncbi:MULTISPECIES: Immediate-early protein 2 [Streptomyces]|uniref:SRPBCC family protein n=1 Tax=Streptomyces olivaceus TaxID=47716 RepID=A0ABS7W3Z6_STROV|nr:MULTISPECIES: Immediate-early protein 2 [Streptomyces]AOW89755.1 Immediate-early protein 2 [Streptomyces olivaceus]MBZ6085356.1 SRPBCC family protein [Streptomyces olivaceus]MBZ6089791.1 SRPBCC family protein [Streptomyces olivaceus]MBZ6098302.1 SRPBCC family protein [Streptomyces olivaceus]MBZ6112206.1 SRPBCC family protein [Streptomyces olivaceus]